MRAETTEDLQQALRAAIRAEVAPLVADLHRFVDRRIAEMSVEINASVQMVDMTEARLSRELSQVHEQIARLVAVPAATTRNSGIELEAVVHATEEAANTILEAAEAIQDWIASGNREPSAIESLAERVNAIFEACSFQDITGQRIRRAIQHLQQVEEMLGRYLPSEAGGTAPPPKLAVRSEMHTTSAAARKTPDLAQDDIDALLNG